jgi:hypothetical protein
MVVRAVAPTGGCLALCFGIFRNGNRKLDSEPDGNPLSGNPSSNTIAEHRRPRSSYVAVERYHRNGLSLILL